MAIPNFLKIFLQRSIIAGTGLSGGGTLSGDVTLKAKLTDSTNTTDSETAASATAVKTAYDRGSAGVTAAGTAQSAAATAQSTANQALNAANGKAPGGYGLGVNGGRLVTDANDALVAGWWTPINNKDALNFYEPNHSLLVIPRNVWGTAQVQFVHGKIAVRELWDNKWEPWVLASVGSAEIANHSENTNAIGGHVFEDKFDTGGNPPWVLGLATDGSNKTRPIKPSALRVSYASSAGSANMKVYAAWHSNAAAALPAGGTWIWIKYANYPDRYNYCNAGTAAGGTWIGNESGIGGNTSGVSICAFQIAA